MYRDVAQWSNIRHRVLVKGISIRQVVRETGISRETVRKMLDHPTPAAVWAEKPQVSEARAAYGLGPADAPRERYPAALGPALRQGHLRAHPRRGGLPRQIQFGEGLRAADQA